MSNLFGLATTSGGIEPHGLLGYCLVELSMVIVNRIPDVDLIADLA